ncbi:MAG TPA: PAS domain S-box protein, partial [bacterium]
MPSASSPFDALVIESDSLAAEMLQRGLEELGFTVTVAAAWAEVWEAVQRKIPRLVVAPLAAESGAPRIGIRKLRTLDGGRRSIVLATHPRAARPDRQALQEIGIDDVLAYPVEPDELDLRLAIARSRLVERQGSEDPLTAQGGIDRAMARSDAATVVAGYDASTRAFRVHSVNPAFERLTGYSSSAVTGRTHRVLVESKDSEALLQCLRES